jgi:hypothetical protein
MQTGEYYLAPWCLADTGKPLLVADPGSLLDVLTRVEVVRLSARRRFGRTMIVSAVSVASCSADRGRGLDGRGTDTHLGGSDQLW